VTGHKCIIVDDICDTAGTLCKAADVLLDAGATEVHAYTTHGVLSGPAVERISGSVLKTLVTTDTIEATAAAKACPRIRVVPTAPMFAQAIVNIWNGTSVSSLFDTASLVPIYDGLYPKGMWGR
jgi:ribose-phosphate pyrophosphokinase